MLSITALAGLTDKAKAEEQAMYPARPYAKLAIRLAERKGGGLQVRIMLVSGGGAPGFVPPSGSHACNRRGTGLDLAM